MYISSTEEEEKKTVQCVGFRVYLEDERILFLFSKHSTTTTPLIHTSYPQKHLRIKSSNYEKTPSIPVRL